MVMHYNCVLLISRVLFPSIHIKTLTEVLNFPSELSVSCFIHNSCAVTCEKEDPTKLM